MKGWSIALLLVGIPLAPASATSAQSVSSGDVWQTDKVEDAMTGDVRVVAYVRGSSGSLAVKCDGSGKPLYIDFVSKQFLGGAGIQRGIREFWYRFDDAPATESMFKYDDEDAWSFRSQDVQAFLSALPSAKKLRVRAETYRGEIVDAEFSTEGAGPAIQQAVATCAKPAAARRKKTLGVHIG